LNPRRTSFYEASARERIAAILDPSSFRELLPPAARVTSPHLEALDLPAAFDDGVVVGEGALDHKRVLVAAEEGQFLGGTVGEVHGAKITGLLRRALRITPAAVLLVLESGGVRLQEANAGLIGVSEVMRSLLSVRAAGIPVLVAIGGQYGCFGGMGIVASCADAVVMSEEGRLGLSGPEVIETARGVEEFDARDRALVWRTVGAKHRYLLGDCDLLVADDLGEFRTAFLGFLAMNHSLGREEIEREQRLLERRLEAFGDCHDAVEIWKRLGMDEPEKIPEATTAHFLEQARTHRAASSS
jgi:malonate decarboxylase beta subunit